MKACFRDGCVAPVNCLPVYHYSVFYIFIFWSFGFIEPIQDSSKLYKRVNDET